MAVCRTVARFFRDSKQDQSYQHAPLPAFHNPPHEIHHTTPHNTTTHHTTATSVALSAFGCRHPLGVNRFRSSRRHNLNPTDVFYRSTTAEWPGNTVCAALGGDSWPLMEASAVTIFRNFRRQHLQKLSPSPSSESLAVSIFRNSRPHHLQKLSPSASSETLAVSIFRNSRLHNLQKLSPSAYSETLAVSIFRNSRRQHIQKLSPYAL